MLVTASLLSAGSCQTAEECAGVNSGLAPALSPCRQSVTSCVENEELNLGQISGIFCSEAARRQYSNFLACEGLFGEGFTDQIFGAICGGPNCTIGQSFSSCRPAEGDRCFEGVVDVNDGSAAFEACLCSNQSQSSASPWCPTECAIQLQQLVRDVGCCLNTVVYSFYFSTCGDSDGLAAGASVTVINNLFNACNLTLPASCLHPFSSGTDTTDPGSGSTIITSGLLAYVVVLGVLALV